MVVCDKLLFQEIPYSDALKIYSYFADQEWSLFLDSSDANHHATRMNRYSYIVFDPFSRILCKNKVIDINGEVSECNNPFDIVNTELKKYFLHVDKTLPPFQGGAVGLFAYDLCHYLEEIPYPKIDDMEFPDLAIGFYDLVISFDNLKNKAWVISSGLPETNPHKRLERAASRLAYTLGMLETTLDEFTTPQNTTFIPPQVNANFSKKTYMQTVEKVIAHIRAGDIFETNLSQRFTASLPYGLKPFELYKQLRQLSPAPFSAYLNLGSSIIASASPERFIQLYNGLVETRPIKGTRRRGLTPEEDKRLAQDLIESEKDKAENVMIVDLMRNDLSKVCDINSIKVPQYCGLETYANVHHLVSVVTGKLKKDLNGLDLLKASFPGGSITGAPKIKSMEIISQLEPNRRGPYCGNIGYIGFDGCMDTSIVIRTYAIKNNTITFQTGGAVVLDSCPEEEYEETLNKASALNKALI